MDRKSDEKDRMWLKQLLKMKPPNNKLEMDGALDAHKGWEVYRISLDVSKNSALLTALDFCPSRLLTLRIIRSK